MTPAQRWSLAAAILGSSIVFLDSTVVNVALERIGDDLPATLVSTLEGQTYINSGYVATLAALLILAGALADYFGRRRVFLIGLVGFGLTSLLCGAAPTLEFLVLARVLQGAAGALLVPGSLAIITALFEGPARARAFGIWAAATSGTTLLGPIVGGVLVDLTWRTVFLINAPLVIAALWATWRYMPETRNENATARFDWLGALVAVAAVGGLAFGVTRGQDRQWQDPLAFAAIAIGVVATIAFPLLMARRSHPLVPLSLFRSRPFATINLSTLLIYAPLYSGAAFQGIYLQGVLEYSPLAAGAASLPAGILLTLFSARVGSLAGRFGTRPFLIVGPLLMAAGQVWLARLPASSAAWPARIDDPTSLIPPIDTFVDLIPAILFFGVGITLVVAPLTSTLMSSIPVARSGLGSAINNAVSRVGFPIMAAVIFLVVSGTFYSTLAEHVPGIDPSSPELRASVQPLNRPAAGVDPQIQAAARIASTDAFHLAALVGAGLLLAGAAVNAVGLRGDHRDGLAEGDQPDGPNGAEPDPPGVSAG